MTRLSTYRNFQIEYDPKPIPDRRFDYNATHIDYDGPEDSRHFCCASEAECKREIDDWYDDQELTPCFERISSEYSPSAPRTQLEPFSSGKRCFPFALVSAIVIAAATCQLISWAIASILLS